MESSESFGAEGSGRPEPMIMPGSEIGSVRGSVVGGSGDARKGSVSSVM